MMDFAIVPKRTALINVDLQNCFVEGVSNGLAIVDRVNGLAVVCREAGILVNKGTKSAALHKGLVVDPRDILLEKPRYGAFHGTDLELILRARGIDTVIISGISTVVCCDTTAREAVARDFRVLFLSDGTATASAELHKGTLAALGTVFAQVLTVDEVIQKISRATRAAAV